MYINQHLKISFGCLLFILNPSCIIHDLMSFPSNNEMGAGAPELNEEGNFADSSYNRQHFKERVMRDINDEKNGTTPDYDWERAWRVSFASFERMEENPKYKKDLVIKLRKEAGLQIWPFMLR